MKRGLTLPEVMSVTAILGILASVATPALKRALDRATVSEGIDRFAAAFATTRQLAISRSKLARMQVDCARRTATLSVQRSSKVWDTVVAYPLGSATIAITNPTLVFNPISVGFGASNTTIIFSRGGAADTATTSRTGRLRH